MNPTAHVYSQLPGGPQYPAGGKDAALLPVPTEVADLGFGLAYVVWLQAQGIGHLMLNRLARPLHVERQAALQQVRRQMAQHQVCVRDRRFGQRHLRRHQA